MDYKGYNIAAHEFGHNVEQTFSLYNIDYYSLSGVTSNAFTEAIAFLFQTRDLKILGIKNTDNNVEYYNSLDLFWSAYEIMGAALVYIYIWKWLYESPNTEVQNLKENAIRILKEVWNNYFDDVISKMDSLILSIYLYITNYTLYLSAYLIEYLIVFRIDQYIQGKNYGRETPLYWMKNAVGQSLSIKPMLGEAQKAVDNLNSR